MTSNRKVRKHKRAPAGQAAFPQASAVMRGAAVRAKQQDQFYNLSALRRPGGSSGEPPPDPIPNSAVKLPSANGTAS